jgi:hypothetical protein
LGSGRGLSSDKNPIIQICVTHFCIIGIISACHNCSCFPNGSLSVYLPELLRGAVKAVIDYIQSGYRSFTYRQEGDVRRYMNSQPDKEEAADTVLNASLPFLKSDEHERVKGQLSYIVQDMKEEQLQSRSRGFHM